MCIGSARDGWNKKKLFFKMFLECWFNVVDRSVEGSAITSNKSKVYVYRYKYVHALHILPGQISIIPKPELRGFWGSSLIKPPFRVTSADVVIICPRMRGSLYYQLEACTMLHMLHWLILWIWVPFHDLGYIIASPPCMTNQKPNNRSSPSRTVEVPHVVGETASDSPRSRPAPKTKATPMSSRVKTTALTSPIKRLSKQHIR